MIKLESWRVLLRGYSLVGRLKGTSIGLFQQALTGSNILNPRGIYLRGPYQPKFRNAGYLVTLYRSIFIPGRFFDVFATYAQYIAGETRAYLLGLACVGVFGKIDNWLCAFFLGRCVDPKSLRMGAKYDGRPDNIHFASVGLKSDLLAGHIIKLSQIRKGGPIG